MSARAPSNRRRLLVVLNALREKRRKRASLVDALNAAIRRRDGLKMVRAEYRVSRPPERHRRKVLDWTNAGHELERKITYAERDVRAAEEKIARFDRFEGADRLAWMIRELLKQRRRMRRNASVRQLGLFEEVES